MEQIIAEVCDALDKLSESILAAYSNDTTLTENFGWSLPALTRTDLSNMAISARDRLVNANITNVDDNLKEKLEEIPERVDVFITHNLPYIFSGNGNHGSATFIGLMEWVNTTIQPLFDWQISNDTKILPSSLNRRLRSIQTELNNLLPDKDLLKDQINLINDAVEAAETLPTDLEALKEARAKVSQLSTNSAELFGKIDIYSKEIEKLKNQIQEKHKEATSIVEQCNEAYRVTTSVGLAGAFDQRANRLNLSMIWWVLGLLVALGFGAWIGAHRVEVLNKLTSATNPQWGAIWIHFILSILSLGTPIWFAWLATKQINQRFRLAEDYAFKASVSKAYEGYRREAVRIDEEFEARLFGSTLDRLEEAPLRFVETSHYGSPFHELLNSDSFQKAVKQVPELKEQLLDLYRGKIKPSLPKVTKESEEEENL